MAIESITKTKLSGDYVQVNIKSKDLPERHFKVPIQEADSFCAEYRSYDKKSRISASVAIGITTLAAALACGTGARLLKAKWGLQLVSTLAGALIGSTVSANVAENSIRKDEKRLLNNYKAEVIRYK